MSLSPAFLDELRARTLLSALIGKSVKLTRAGREWKACCPFHNEKTPSFTVNDEKGFYHCFGCGAHGDAIRWMTDQRGLPFIDAVKELAQAAGMDMPEPDRRSAERAERARGLHDVMEDARKWFSDQLHGIAGAQARAALERRGISAETARIFSIGFAPDARGRLREALHDYGDAMLVEAGLLIQVEGKEPYDRFRGRLMIPIRDVRGRVIAFGGRILGEGEPKYLNSPETPLFDKGRTLFNIDRAQAAARRTDRIIAVEGYMDVIALAQAGVEDVVAPLGTAMTEHQIERMWRMSDVPILCLDGDSAGQKAAIRAAHRALPLLAPGRSLSFVTLPDAMDPDDFVRARGKAAFDALLDKAEPMVDRLWAQELSAEPLDTPERRAGLRRRLNELAQTIADPMVRGEYQAEFRQRADALFRPAQGARGGNAMRGGAGRGTWRPNARGRNGGWVPPERPPSPAARGVGTAGLDHALAKSVLSGLIRYPTEIARHAEALERLRSGDGALARLGDSPLARMFETVLDASLRHHALDSAQLRTILAQSGFGEDADALLRPESLSLSFARAPARGNEENSDPEAETARAATEKARQEARARALLDEAITVMATRPAVEAELTRATADLAEGFTDAAFARQVALVKQRQELEARLANLLRPDEYEYNNGDAVGGPGGSSGIGSEGN